MLHASEGFPMSTEGPFRLGPDSEVGIPLLCRLIKI